MKKKYSIDEIFFILIALSGILISFLDLFGFLDWVVIKNRISTISLLLVSLLLGYISNLHRHILTFYNKEIKEAVDSVMFIRNSLKQIQIDQLSFLPQYIDPTLSKIFSDKIFESIEMLTEILKENKISIYDQNRFKYYYISLLKAMPREHFFATSIPSPEYLWSAEDDFSPLENAIKKHIDEGGHFTRIFYIDENEEDNTYSKAIINKQLKMGVNVYTIPYNKTPSRLSKTFLFTKNEIIASEAHFINNNSKELEKTTITVCKKDILKYKSYFDQLLNLQDISKVT